MRWSTEHRALLRPARDARDLPKVSLGEGLDSVDGFQEQHVLLQVGREPQERQQLRDPRPGQTETPGCIGLVDELLAGDRAGDGVGEREHHGDPRRAADRGPRRRWLGRKRFPMPMLDAVQRSGDDRRHGASPTCARSEAVLAVGPSPARSATKTRIWLAGSSTSTRSMTARTRRARFSGVSTSQI